MKINYYLMENSFNSPKDRRFVAKVKKPGILYQEDLVSAMLSKNTVFSRQEINGILDLMNETVQEKVLSGYSVHTDLFRTGVSIRGSFGNPDDKFDNEKHSVCVNMKASLEFQRRISRRSRVRKVNQQYVVPTILAVEKLGREKAVNTYLPGDLIEIRGYALKREDGNSPVYLYPAGGENDWERDRISLEVYRVFDRSVLCRLPELLKPGSYRLLVDSSIDRSRPMAAYGKALSVMEAADHSQAE